MKLLLIRGNIWGYYQLQVNADDIASVCIAVSHCLFQLILIGIKKMKGLVTQSCLTLYDPMDCSPPGSPVHGILQARILEEIAIPFSRRSSQPRDQIWISCVAGRFFTVWNTGEVRMVYLFTGNIQISDNSPKWLKAYNWHRHVWEYVCSGNSTLCHISRRKCAFHFGPKKFPEKSW